LFITQNIMKTITLLKTAICLLFLTVGLHGQSPTVNPDSENTEAQESAEKKVILTPAEQKAVDTYKSQMLAIQTWLTDYIDSAHNNEARAHRIPLLVSEKLANVTTDGLPAGIIQPFLKLKKNIDAHAAHLKDLPADDGDAMEWMANKLADEKWAAEANTLQTEQSELEQQLAYDADPFGAGKESDLFQITELSQIKDRWVVILGAYKKFTDAEAEAQKVAKATSTMFSLRGMIHDAKGLHMPDDLEDEVYAGQYVLRSRNELYDGDLVSENHISVEDSSGYEGFEPGYFIPVGFIAETAEEAEKQAAIFKKHAPGTYVKKTEIYMGCDR
jgi:hypothetical protein